MQRRNSSKPGPTFAQTGSEKGNEQEREERKGEKMGGGSRKGEAHFCRAVLENRC